jgi:hypothetical protein
MNLFARILFAVLMLALAGFCVFGFIITFDNNPAFTMNSASAKWLWRGIYAFATFISAGTAVSLLWPRRAK